MCKKHIGSGRQVFRQTASTELFWFILSGESSYSWGNRKSKSMLQGACFLTTQWLFLPVQS